MLNQSIFFMLGTALLVTYFFPYFAIVFITVGSKYLYFQLKYVFKYLIVCNKTNLNRVILCKCIILVISNYIQRIIYNRVCFIAGIITFFVIITVLFGILGHMLDHGVKEFKRLECLLKSPVVQVSLGWTCTFLRIFVIREHSSVLGRTSEYASWLFVFKNIFYSCLLIIYY